MTCSNYKIDLNAIAFDKMVEESDVTGVNIERQMDPVKYAEDTKLFDIDGEAVHSFLQTAGLAPGVGIAPDLLDAAIFAFQGDPKNMALSLGAALPMFGQALTVTRKTQKAIEKGDDFIKVYRGYDNWKRGDMVEGGRFVGGRAYIGKDMPGVSRNSAWVTTDKNYASGAHVGKPKGIVLEFKIPKVDFNKNFMKRGVTEGHEFGTYNLGVPKEYLVKVHKYSNPNKNKIDPTHFPTIKPK